MVKEYDPTDINNLINPETKRKYSAEVELFAKVWSDISRKEREILIQKAQLELNLEGKNPPKDPPEWIQTIRKLKRDVEDEKKLKQLSPELENQFPELIKQFRQFYFSLSEEERKKLTKVEKPLSSVTATQKTKKEKYCYECGQIINRTAKFCEHCGTKQPLVK
ncbi:zinc ribbon domain-containing protein [Candidatus Woesearchaeota archaeon]|jgi:hypothetical protein|nr:zinc ribbon domain-containing protein [Candidatus Woesearchaeota archaeon]MBT5272935.1 zinc ribbon domain-containing protein [Candidatus Woesearchaeota archaeon]MBT6041401.1 zinc ribbon domain-containing protein [Candidatus Woesearchaeota archaeon]MBT6337284.1 zinc ribbon domain-containing protein [Candidatus Woesearchaeota archaeon]MBT7927161.1 zinc ribbon domain-containing protein [Candidatus Woesearchaeota archaeon]